MKNKVTFILLVTSLVFSGGLNASDAKTASEQPQLVKPEITKQILPQYPTALRAHGVEGKVLVEGLLDQHGKLHGLQTMETSHKGFSEAALKAVSQWQFTPAEREGEAIPVVVQIPFKFKLVLPEDVKDGNVQYGDLEPIVMLP